MKNFSPFTPEEDPKAADDLKLLGDARNDLLASDPRGAKNSLIDAVLLAKATLRLWTHGGQGMPLAIEERIQNEAQKNFGTLSSEDMKALRPILAETAQNDIATLLLNLSNRRHHFIGSTYPPGAEDAWNDLVKILGEENAKKALKEFNNPDVFDTAILVVGSSNVQILQSISQVKAELQTLLSKQSKAEEL